MEQTTTVTRTKTKIGVAVAAAVILVGGSAAAFFMMSQQSYAGTGINKAKLNALVDEQIKEYLETNPDAVLGPSAYFDEGQFNVHVDERAEEIAENKVNDMRDTVENDREENLIDLGIYGEADNLDKWKDDYTTDMVHIIDNCIDTDGCTE